jgi:hypothetical protein
VFLNLACPGALKRFAMKKPVKDRLDLGVYRPQVSKLLLDEKGDGHNRERVSSAFLVKKFD